MVQYATADDLAAFLQTPVNTGTMNLLLQLASAAFDTKARTTFAHTTATYTAAGDGSTRLTLPRFPLVSVESATINGTAVTDWTLVDATLCRVDGWGDPCVFPPDAIAIGYTYGYASAPDDVRLAVLDTAAGRYTNPSGATQVQIDDYQASFSAGEGLSDFAMDVAKKYRRPAGSVGKETTVEPQQFVSSQWYSPMNNIYGGGVIVP